MVRNKIHSDGSWTEINTQYFISKSIRTGEKHVMAKVIYNPEEDKWLGIVSDQFKFFNTENEALEWCELNYNAHLGSVKKCILNNI